MPPAPQEEIFYNEESIDYDKNGEFLSAIVIATTWGEYMDYKMKEIY